MKPYHVIHVMSPRYVFQAVTMSLLFNPLIQAQIHAKPEPTYASVQYGPHERNLLDFYQAKSDGPTPLVIYIPGGGFVKSSRTGVVGSAYVNTTRKLLDAGISVAGLSYRIIQDTPLPAAFHDCRRALQFLRSQSKPWNIDKTRVAAFGGSAGAQICMYLAFHNEMSDPNSHDPIARQSTRLACVATYGGQTTMDMDWWKANIPGYSQPHRDQTKTYGEISVEELHQVIRDTAALALISADDPPIHMEYEMAPSNPIPLEKTRSWQVHHVNFGLALKKKMESLGIDCTVNHVPDKANNTFAEFFIAQLLHLGAPGDRATSRPRLPGISISEDLCPVNVVMVKAADGVETPLAYRIPLGKGPFPAIVFFHGGTGGGDRDGRVLDVKEGATHTRFLKKGYVIASATRRKVKGSPYVLGAWKGCLLDAIVSVETIKNLPVVDPRSVAIYGGSAGGALGFQVAGKIDIAALVGGEPANHAFTGILAHKPRGEKNNILMNCRDHYTAKVRDHTRSILSAIRCPVLVLDGGIMGGLNTHNKTIIIPELRALGKEVESISYQGYSHGFYWGSSRRPITANGLDKVVGDAERFIRKHIHTIPKGMEAE